MSAEFKRKLTDRQEAKKQVLQRINKIREKLLKERNANSDEFTISTIQMWDEIKLIIDSLEFDAYKTTVKHQYLPSVRFRHGLRLLRDKITKLVNTTVKLDKIYMHERKRAKALKEQEKDNDNN